MKNNRITLMIFRSALLELDKKLGLIGETIIIKAIGGFALLYYGIRISEYTADIDTLTEHYNQNVLRCIEEVANEFNLPNDWVNNDNVLDDTDTVESILDPFWNNVNWGLKNIELLIADLDTLLRSKLISADDSNLTGRVQDFPDLIEILKKVGCTNFEDCVRYVRYLDLDLQIEFPNAYNRLNKYFIL